MEDNLFTVGLEETTGDAALEQDKKLKRKKLTVVITYIIALLCLIAGLVTPLYGYVKGGKATDMMLIKYLPLLLNNALGFFFKKPLIGKVPDFFAPTEWTEWSGGFDFGSFALVLYAVMCVIALIMLIFVCAGKKEKRGYARCALGVELVTFVILVSYIAYYTYYMTITGIVVWTNWNIFVAGGGALLMAIVQSVSTKGSIGVSKTIAVIFSAIATIALLDITIFSSTLAKGLNALSNTLKCGENANFIGGLSLPTELGIDGISILINIKNNFETIFKAPPAKMIAYLAIILVAVLTLVNLLFDILGLGTGHKFKANREASSNKASNTFAITRYCFTLVFVIVLIVLTFVIKDITAGIYLYILAAALVILLINAIARTVAAKKRVKSGAIAPTNEGPQRIVLQDPAFSVQSEPLQMEPLMAPAADVIVDDNGNVQPVDDAFNFQPVFNDEAPLSEGFTPVEETYTEPVQEETVEQPVEETYVEPVQEDFSSFGDFGTFTQPVEQPVEPEYVQPVQEEVAPVGEQPVQESFISPFADVEPAPAEPSSTVYVYGGPSDEFMDTLTEAEKIEFVDVFVKRTKVSVNGVPKYEIEADNSDFFPAVFVHINRYRNTVSDGLMAKLYKQLGKI